MGNCVQQHTWMGFSFLSRTEKEKREIAGIVKEQREEMEKGAKEENQV